MRYCHSVKFFPCTFPPCMRNHGCGWRYVWGSSFPISATSFFRQSVRQKWTNQGHDGHQKIQYHHLNHRHLLNHPPSRKLPSVSKGQPARFLHFNQPCWKQRCCCQLQLDPHRLAIQQITCGRAYREGAQIDKHLGKDESQLEA